MRTSYTRTVSAYPNGLRYVVSVEGRPIGSVEFRPGSQVAGWFITTTEHGDVPRESVGKTRDEAAAWLLDANGYDRY